MRRLPMEDPIAPRSMRFMTHHGPHILLVPDVHDTTRR